jgi:hypothetical protein
MWNIAAAIGALPFMSESSGDIGLAAIMERE